MRARMSAAPPGAKVLTMRTGRDGHSSADAGRPARMKLPARAKSAAPRRLMGSPRYFSSIGTGADPKLNSEFVALAAFGDIEEQFIEREPPPAQALLVRICDEPLEVPGVALFQSIFPGVLAEDALLLFPALAVPGQRHDARVFHPLHGEGLGLLERLVEIGGHPRMPLDDLLLDPDHMHDRKDAGLAIEGDLLLLVVRKQPPDALVTCREWPDQVGREQCVDLALDQHVFERFFLRDLSDVETSRRRKVDILIELAEPFDRFVRHAVIVLEDPAHPESGGEQVALGADLAADQIGRLADALRGVDEDEAMTEAAMGENRYRAERKVLVPRRHVARARHLRDVELAAAQEPPVPRRRAHVGQYRELDPFRADDAFL